MNTSAAEGSAVPLQASLRDNNKIAAGTVRTASAMPGLSSSGSDQMFLSPPQRRHTTPSPEFSHMPPQGGASQAADPLHVRAVPTSPTTSDYRRMAQETEAEAWDDYCRFYRHLKD